MTDVIFINGATTTYNVDQFRELGSIRHVDYLVVRGPFTIWPNSNYSTSPHMLPGTPIYETSATEIHLSGDVEFLVIETGGSN